jgi:hypothetical protein
MSKIILKHQVLVDFLQFARNSVPVLVTNVLLLLEEIPKELTNPVLRFLLMRAPDRVFDVLVLEVEQTWRLLAKEASTLNDYELERDDPDYQDLKRIRDKLVAHRLEVTVGTTEHVKWYAERYGSYEKTSELIKRVAGKIEGEIRRLMRRGKLHAVVRPLMGPHAIQRRDIDQLVDALRAKRIL